MTRIRRCIAYGGEIPLADTLATVDAAERAGLDGVWSAEHIGLQDALVPSVAYALRTTRLEIGLVGLNADTRSPGVLGMELATLAALAPGRVRIQVGTGSRVRARRIAVTEPRTVRGVETFVSAMRGLLAGEVVTAASEAFALDGLRLELAPVPPVPVDVMAIRPRMLDLAARVGDGVSLSAGASREYLRGAIGAVREGLARYGRDPDRFRISGVVAAAIADDLAEARRALALSPMLRLRMPEMQAGVDLPDPARVDEVLERHGPDAAVELFGAGAVEQLGIVATPHTLQATVEEFRQLGLDEVVVMLSGDPAGHPRIARQLVGPDQEGAS